MPGYAVHSRRLPVLLYCYIDTSWFHSGRGDMHGLLHLAGWASLALAAVAAASGRVFTALVVTAGRVVR